MIPYSLVAAPLVWHSVAAVLWDTWEFVLLCSRTMLSVRLPWHSIFILVHSFWSQHWLCCHVICTVPWCCVGTFPMLHINVKLHCNIVPIPSTYLPSWLYCSTSAFTETRHTVVPSALLQQHHKQVSFVHTFHWYPLELSAMLWEVKQSLYRPWWFQEVEAPRFRDSRYMKVVSSALRTGRLYPPGNIPGSHFC